MADIALGFGVYWDVVIENDRRRSLRCIKDFTIEQHSKMPRRQDAELAMLFFFRPLISIILTRHN